MFIILKNFYEGIVCSRNLFNLIHIELEKFSTDFYHFEQI